MTIFLKEAHAICRYNGVHLRTIFFTISLFLFCFNVAVRADNCSGFAIAKVPVPVFNSPHAALPNAILKPDNCGLIRELEFIALPGTVFREVRPVSGLSGVVRLTSVEYQPPDGVEIYALSEMLQQTVNEPRPRQKKHLEKEQIVKRLRSAVGTNYVWGGNLREGVMLHGSMQFRGLDCSGLLYEATDGATPRNTQQLLNFGTAVKIEKAGLQDLLQMVRPLDLIVWKGHVVIVLDQETTVESLMNCNGAHYGVILTPLKKRFEQIMKKRSPADNWPNNKKKAPLFVIRRWI